MLKRKRGNGDSTRKFLEVVSELINQKIRIWKVTCPRPRMGSTIHLELPKINGLLIPEEFKQVGEAVIKEAQIEAYRQEFEALTNRKPLPKKSSMLNLNQIIKSGLMRSNTWLRSLL